MFQRTTAVNKIVKMRKRFRIIPGGSSAGKTLAIISILIDQAIALPTKRIDVVSMTYGHLIDGAIADFKRIMEESGRWEEECWHDTKHTYTFSNKSFIRFKSMDRAGKAKGPRRDILYINEANEIDFETFFQLEARTADWIYIDYNPSNRFWVDDEVIPLPNAEVLTLTYRDNEGCPLEVLKGFEIKRQKALTSPYWQNWCNVYLDGQIGSIEGVIFSNWSTIDTIPVDAKLLGYGMDFGYTNDPTTLIALYTYNNTLLIDQVIYKRGLSNGDIVSLMKQNNVSGRIYADSAEPKTIAEIKGYGFNIKPTKKGKDSIVYGISLLQEETICITKRSRETIDEFTMYAWARNVDGSTENTPEDLHNHAIDAIRYFVMMNLGKSNYTDPRYFGEYTAPPKVVTEEAPVTHGYQRPIRRR